MTESFSVNFSPESAVKILLETGVQFGHKTNLWNPKMAPYIYGIKDGMHIIDVRKTATMLFRALSAVRNVAANNGRILFVNTKKTSNDIVQQAALRCGQYYTNCRWLGGMLTNFSTVLASLKVLKEYEDILTNRAEQYTKKELLQFTRKHEKLVKLLGGVTNLGGLPDMLFVIDAKMHKIALLEAAILGIPVVAVVDTNSSPIGVDYVIPGNDDSRKATELYCNLIADAVLEGIQDSVSNAKTSTHDKDDRGGKVRKKEKRAKISDYQIEGHERSAAEVKIEDVVTNHDAAVEFVTSSEECAISDKSDSDGVDNVVMCEQQHQIQSTNDVVSERCNDVSAKVMKASKGVKASKNNKSKNKKVE